MDQKLSTTVVYKELCGLNVAHKLSEQSDHRLNQNWVNAQQNLQSDIWAK